MRAHGDRGQQVTVGASLGVTVLDESTASDALRTADLAMYGVKEQNDGGGVRLAMA